MLNQTRLCPRLAYGLKKKLRLLSADDGFTETRARAVACSTEMGAFHPRSIGEPFWRCYLSWVLKDGWEVSIERTLKIFLATLFAPSLNKTESDHSSERPGSPSFLTRAALENHLEPLFSKCPAKT